VNPRGRRRKPEAETPEVQAAGQLQKLVTYARRPMLRQACEDAFADEAIDGFEHTDRGHGRVVLKHAQVIENTGDAARWRVGTTMSACAFPESKNYD